MEAVFPIHFFAFAISAAVVRNADFVDAASGFGQLGGDFRLETESVFAKIKALHQRRAKRFVARFQIGEVQIRKHVREQRQKSVPDHVPKIKNAMRATAHEP